MVYEVDVFTVIGFDLYLECMSSYVHFSGHMLQYLQKADFKFLCKWFSMSKQTLETLTHTELFEARYREW